MKKKKQNSRNLVICGILLAVFAAFLIGVMIWEVSRTAEPPETQPVTESTPAVQTNPVTTAPPETILPPETTLPVFEARQIHFLLVGRDAHGEGENGRSDSMILCSVDTGKKTVTMISFLRDMYVKIPGYGSNKLNAAYSWGGAELLIGTLEENFGVRVDVTLEIDFEGFKGLIDALGGVEITLTDREARHLNKNNGWALTEGTNHLDGRQALTYSRIRYLDSDFVRTERQRNVLTALLNKYRSATIAQMLTVTDIFLDESTSNHTDEELLDYALELYPVLAQAELTTHRIPADGSFTYEKIRGMSVIKVDFEESRQLLTELLG